LLFFFFFFLPFFFTLIHPYSLLPSRTDRQFRRLWQRFRTHRPLPPSRDESLSSQCSLCRRSSRNRAAGPAVDRQSPRVSRFFFFFFFFCTFVDECSANSPSTHNIRNACARMRIFLPRSRVRPGLAAAPATARERRLARQTLVQGVVVILGPRRKRRWSAQPLRTPLQRSAQCQAPENHNVKQSLNSVVVRCTCGVF
jgi:hypothetical protein